MSDVFVPGPLAHLPLLETVLGRPVDKRMVCGARLSGYAMSSPPGQPGVLVQKMPGATLVGLLLRGLGADDLARLRYYQGSYGLDPQPLAVARDDETQGPAQVFLSRDATGQAGQEWTEWTEGWVTRWGDIAVAAAGEIMAQMAQLDPDQVARRLVGIHLRAAAFVAARHRSGRATRDLARDVVVHAHHHTYSNFFAAQEMDLQYRRYDGDLSPVMNRGAQILGQAAVVLPYDPVQDAVLMVEQFRAPLFMGGDRAPWLWQPVAGLVDPGETPEVAAHREAMEEAGLVLSELFTVGGVYSSAGANSDFVNLFVGLGDFSSRAPGGGLAEEGEDIKVAIVGFDQLMADIDAGHHRDMQLVLTSLWLARHRDRLRHHKLPPGKIAT